MAVSTSAGFVKRIISRTRQMAFLASQEKAKGVIILEAPIIDWYCPNCGLTQRTKEPRPHTRYHTCPKLGMLSAPMLEADLSAKVEANEREDYLGEDAGHVRLDANGRPVMNIITTRDEGIDAMVFAPTATLRAGDL